MTASLEPSLSKNCPAGIRLLEDARRHKFDQILVFKLDPPGRTAPTSGGSVKNLASETIRLMQAAADTRDRLRRLAADLRPLALKDSIARRQRVMIPEARPLWAITGG
jgi:hypothetical protein